MNSFTFLLFIIICILLSIHYSNAQACSSAANGDYNSSYSLRPYSPYDPAIQQCVNGTAGVCTQFYTDTTGCSARSNCTFTSSLNQCVDNGSPCYSLTLQSSCSLRSDCQWVVSACQSNPGALCASSLTSGECGIKNCLWDYYLGKCFASAAEITNQYACSIWNNYPDPQSACQFQAHSCTWTGSTCINIGSGVGQSDSNNSQSYTEFSVFFSNPRVDSGTLTFRVDETYDLIIDPKTPVFQYTTIGAIGSGTYTQLQPRQYCTNMRTVGYPTPVANYDVNILRNVYFQRVKGFGDFDFPVNQAGLYLRQNVVGDFSPGNLTQSVTIAANNATITESLAVDLGRAVANCTNLPIKPSRVSGFGSTYYIIPISNERWVYIKQADGSASVQTFETTSYFYVRFDNTGYITFMSTSQYKPSMYITPALFLSAGCPVNQQRLRLTVTLSYDNVFDSAVVVCPRNCSDIQFTNPTTGNFTSAYSDTCLSITTPMRSGTVSWCSVLIQSACRVIDSSGDAFKFANNANAADRIALMGADIPFPSSYDKMHSFYVTPYQWNFATQTGYATAQQAINGYPDPVIISYNQKVYPHTGTEVVAPKFDLMFGLLPTPTSPLSAMNTLGMYTNGVTTYSTMDKYNAQLRFDNAFTPVIAYSNETILNSVDLRYINDYFNMTFVPLDAQGNIIPGKWPVYWSNISRYVSHVDKNGVAQCEVACARNPGVIPYPGADALSIDVPALRAILPANGFGFSVGYRSDSSNYFASRRLLSVEELSSGRHLLSSHHASTTLFQEGAFSIKFWIDDTGREMLQVGNQTVVVNVPYNSELLNISGPRASVATSFLVVFLGTAASYLMVTTAVESLLRIDLQIMKWGPTKEGRVGWNYNEADSIRDNTIGNDASSLNYNPIKPSRWSSD